MVVLAREESSQKKEREFITLTPATTDETEELRKLRKLATTVNTLLEYEWFLRCTMPDRCGKYDDTSEEVPTCIACALKTELYEMTMDYAREI